MTVQVNAQTPLSLAMVSDLNMLNPHKNKTERRGPGREKRESLGERGAQREDLRTPVTLKTCLIWVFAQLTHADRSD